MAPRTRQAKPNPTARHTPQAGEWRDKKYPDEEAQDRQPCPTGTTTQGAGSQDQKETGQSTRANHKRNHKDRKKAKEPSPNDKAWPRGQTAEKGKPHAQEPGRPDDGEGAAPRGREGDQETEPCVPGRVSKREN